MDLKSASTTIIRKLTWKTQKLMAFEVNYPNLIGKLDLQGLSSLRCGSFASALRSAGGVFFSFPGVFGSSKNLSNSKNLGYFLGPGLCSIMPPFLGDYFELL